MGLYIYVYVCVGVCIYIYMGPLQLAIYDSWWQAIELTKKKNNHQLGYHLVAPHCTMYIYMAMGQNPGTK